MSGIPQFNFPAFDAASKDIRENLGVDVVSPAEMDSEAVRADAMVSEDGQFKDGLCGGETWGDFLSRDVKVIADECDGVILMEGWQFSRGARLECYVAMSCGMPIKAYVKGNLYDITYTYCLSEITKVIIMEREAGLMKEVKTGVEQEDAA
jgi:hypothetical protein